MSRSRKRASAAAGRASAAGSGRTLTARAAHRPRLSGDCAESSRPPGGRRALSLRAGEAREKGIYEAAREYDFADLKGDIDTIGALAGGLNWEEGGPNWLHPTRRGAIHLQAVIPSEARNLSGIGFAGQLAKRMAERLK